MAYQRVVSHNVGKKNTIVLQVKVYTVIVSFVFTDVSINGQLEAATSKLICWCRCTAAAVNIGLLYGQIGKLITLCKYYFLTQCS